MICYDSLKEKLEELEGKIANSRTITFPSSSEVRGSGSSVQGYGLDVATKEQEHRLVVAVGGNYTQAKQKTPRDQTGLPSSVEDDLANCRKHLLRGFSDYNNPERSRVWENKRAAVSANLSLPEDFHLVMTNLCLWITERSWQNLQSQIRADLLENNPPFRGTTLSGKWAHLIDLAVALEGHDILWVGHGIHCEVFALFRQFIRSLSGAHWMLMPNLAFYYDYHTWPFLH